jgi:creatinine amidohydrolase
VGTASIVKGVTMLLEESTWEDAAKMFASTELALIPIGAIECHGPHNPMGIECFLVEELARRLNTRVNAIVTPVIPVSYSRAWNEFPGTLWVMPASLKAYLEDICNCLVDYGVRFIFFLNGHGPNVPTVEEISHDLALRDVQCAQIDIWRFIGSLSGDLGESDLPLGHSGELATSVMMALRCDLVRREKIRAESPRKTLRNDFPSIIQYYPSSASTPSAFAGDPSKASREKGQEILTRCVDRLEDFLKQWLTSCKG